VVEPSSSNIFSYGAITVSVLLQLRVGQQQSIIVNVLEKFICFHSSICCVW